MRNILRALGLLTDPGAWIDPAQRVLICAYPRGPRTLADLHRRGIRRFVNLHHDPHPPAHLNAIGISECHVPVPDFSAPTLSQAATALAAMHETVKAGDRVAVHCAGGLGRSGTIAACYLVDLGWNWREAVAAVRAVRPGSIETTGQVALIAEYAARREKGPPGRI